MKPPFEGIFGGNCELKIIEFLLPLNEMDFNISELAEEAGVSRPTADRIIKKFVDWEIMKITQKRGGTTYYELNFGSPFVHWFESLNNILIEEMLDEETLFQINDYWKEHAPKLPFGEKQLKPELTIISQIGREDSSWDLLKRDQKSDVDLEIIPQKWMGSYGGDLNGAG